MALRDSNGSYQSCGLGHNGGGGAFLMVLPDLLSAEPNIIQHFLSGRNRTQDPGGEVGSRSNTSHLTYTKNILLHPLIPKPTHLHP